MIMKFVNKAVTYIANSLVFQEGTKYMEVDCHYIRGMVQSGVISTQHITLEVQVAICLSNLFLLVNLLELVTR